MRRHGVHARHEYPYGMYVCVRRHCDTRTTAWMDVCVRETRVVKRDDARARLHPGAAAGHVCRVANV